MDSGGRRFFLVERYVPSMTPAAIASAAQRLDDSTDDAARHVCTLLVAEEETCLSVFEASDEDAVRAANERARFLIDRIVEVDLFSAAQSDEETARVDPGRKLKSMR